MIFRRMRFPILVSLQKIWDKAPHNAMTDLIRFGDVWLCAFREAEQHMHGNGCIRLLASLDGHHWISLTLLEQIGIDLRDPKLSITPDGRLMLLAGGTTWGEDGKYISLQARVAFSTNGKEWTPFTTILQTHEWLWRITWYKGLAYGISYAFSDPADRSKEWALALYKSVDGLEWIPIIRWDIPGHPNESTVRFKNDGTMVALVRRAGNAYIGISPPPYIDWSWADANYHFGGPNFIITPDNGMWAGGRLIARTPYGFFEKTVLAEMSHRKLNPILYLPSGGDTSYPGMVFHDGLIWMSYYSTHETNTAIYLARIAI